MRTPFPHGFLIAIEGIDGAGKTTVAALLAQHWGERGIRCTLTKEPTSVGAGQRLRASAQEGRLTVEEELELFYEDRLAHVQRTIAPALAEGGVVIVDRYFWSTAAYQGARGAKPQEILERYRKSVPQPHLFLLLDISPEQGRERICARGDKPNAFEELTGLARSREIFLELHRSGEFSSVLLDAAKELRALHREAIGAMLEAAHQQNPTSLES